MPGLLRGVGRTAVIAGHRDHRLQPRQPPPGEQVGRGGRAAAGRPSRSRRRSRRRRRRRRRAEPRAASTSSRSSAELKEQGVLTDDGVRRREGAHPAELTAPSGAGRLAASVFRARL